MRIIEDGYNTFIGRCNNCGCKFEYNLSDVSIGVICPHCGGYVVHSAKNHKETTADEKQIKFAIRHNRSARKIDDKE